MKNPFSNPFTKENADYTEPMSKEDIGDIIFEPNTRRQFLRRLSNGIVGVGAANRFGSIIYKTRDDEIIDGHILEMNVENKIGNIIDISFKSKGKYRGKREQLKIPVNVKINRSPDETIAIQSKCIHMEGFEYKDIVRLDQLNNKEVWLGISDKTTMSNSGPPVKAKIVALYD